MPTKNMTRRTVLAGIGAAGISSAASGATVQPNNAPIHKRSWDAIVVGSGVFGAWTAHHLQQAGKKVLLVDGSGPANARSSSGGETRMIRSSYGADAIYTQMATNSLSAWKRLSSRAELPLFHQTGVLFFFQQMTNYARHSIETHTRLKLPLEVLDNNALRKGFPQIDFTGVEFGLYEVGFGALLARRAIQHLVSEFVKAGGSYRQAQASKPSQDGHSLFVGNRTESAEHLIYACGPWMGTLFPELLAPRLFVTRQEVAFVAPPSGSGQFGLGSLPGWADFNNGDLYYGFPDIEGRGFKIARDKHGDAFDPELGNRRVSDKTFANLRSYMERRFPNLKNTPFIGERVCQYTNSSDGNLLIDRHPDMASVLLVGAGSGHGFKHGPEVGRMAAELALDNKQQLPGRFKLATKEPRQNRAVL